MKNLEKTFEKIEPLGFTKSVAIENFVITSFEQPPMLSISCHSHESATLLCVFNGSVDENFKRKTYECFSSSLLIRPAEETHSHSYGNIGAKCLAIQIKPDFLNANQRIFKVFESVSFYRKSPLINLGKKIQRELEMMDEVSSIAIESLVLEMFVRLFRGQKNSKNLYSPKWLKDAKDLVHSPFREKLSLSNVARSVAIHPTHLAEMFHNHFGYTLGEYIRNLRLDYAFREIKETEKTLAEIAIDAGFYDQSHFTKKFREKFDKTPMAARMAFKKSK